MNDEAVIEMVRVAKDRAGGVRALAREWGVSPTYISLLLRGHGSPGPRILKPLGLRRVETIEFAPAAKSPAR